MNGHEMAVCELSQEIQQGLDAAQKVNPEITTEQHLKTLALEVVDHLSEIDEDYKKHGATWQDLIIKLQASTDALNILAKTL